MLAGLTSFFSTGEVVSYGTDGRHLLEPGPATGGGNWMHPASNLT